MWRIKRICAVTQKTVWLYLLAVLADVRVDLVERAEHVELRRVESGLFSQVSVHVLVANGWQPVDVSVVPVGTVGAKVGETNRII